MERASTTNRLAPDVTEQCERCWVLLGKHQGRIWLAQCVDRSEGEPTTVQFDGPAVLQREECCHDVVGFLHTHPSSAAVPSQRDLCTMRAWCRAFGKPLLCVIDGIDGLVGYRFDDDESDGERLLTIETFSRGILIGVDNDGG